LFALVLLGLAPRAWAAEAGAEAWAARCPAERGLAATVSFRAEALLVFELAPSGLQVEVRPDSPKSFRHAGAIGVSPIGEFADWNQAPAAQQAALETFVACAAADPTLAFTGAPLSALERSAHRAGAVVVAVPWLLLGGLAALAAALWRARELRRRLPLLAGLFGGALALRAVLLPWAFFHQNGQGPLWIDYALGEPSPYGPGYREVFGWAARWALDGAHAPDRAVFAAQAVLGALVVPAGWLLANRAGARPALGLVVALLLALDPSLARAAQSESYYATLASLLFLATAALSLGACRPSHGALGAPAASERIGSVSFGLGVLGAGLFIAQAARLHPIGWVAAATSRSRASRSPAARKRASRRRRSWPSGSARSRSSAPGARSSPSRAGSSAASGSPKPSRACPASHSPRGAASCSSPSSSSPAVEPSSRCSLSSPASRPAAPRACSGTVRR
jgi:hypothetical protein